MRVRNTEFENVLGASGAHGFFGRAYPYHRLLRRMGLLDFTGSTFVAKTTTLHAKAGYMRLHGPERDFEPIEWFPKCIVVKPIQGVALNAVGLAGPGGPTLFDTGKWQARTKPFFLSFMSVAETPAKRTEELASFLDFLRTELPRFKAPVGLQINYSCPNVGLHPEELVGEVTEGLHLAAALCIPLMPKFNVLLPVETAKRISEHPACDALCISNTVPYGALPNRINWRKLFGSDVSPLVERLKGPNGEPGPPGGLSGKPLLPLLLHWLEDARNAGIKKPINAGGGILCVEDAEAVFRRGASSIFLGSIAFLRPFNVRGIISSMNRT